MCDTLPSKTTLSAAAIAQMIDLSCVQASSTQEEIREMAQTAREHNCICCFALPAHTPLLVELLADRPDILIGGVVGFPGGGTSTASKRLETQELLAMGCREIDMVINIAWLKSGRFDLVSQDIAAVVKVAGATPVKVILECHYLSDEQIIKACELAAEAGVSFVKTGTGWAPTGATLENVRLMKQTVGDRCRVKAAGGVRSLEILLALHEAGATRFGIGVRTARQIFQAIGGQACCSSSASY